MGIYAYDSQNRRTKKVAGGNTTQYVYGLDGLLYGEYDNSGTMIREYVYLDDQPLAQIDAGSPEVPTYLHPDHLGKPIYATNSGGTQVWAANSDAFGVGTPSGSRTVNIRMPGQYYDSESGLFYNWNRYYNPATGRYISSDPIGIDGGLNTYLYAEASPVMYSDPEGLAVRPECMKFPGSLGCGGLLEGGGGGGARGGAGRIRIRDLISGIIGVSSTNADDEGQVKAPAPVIQGEVCEPGNPTGGPDDDGGDKPYKNKTPTDSPDNFYKKKGRWISKYDGSVWEKDYSQHGGSTWKRWQTLKEWEKRKKSTIYQAGWECKMTMERELFNRIYASIIKLWPAYIDTSFKDVSSDGGARIPQLIKHHEAVEEQLSTITQFNSDDIAQVDWAIYTIFHAEAKKSASICTQDICMNKIYEKLLENLRFLGTETNHY